MQKDVHNQIPLYSKRCIKSIVTLLAGMGSLLRAAAQSTWLSSRSRRLYFNRHLTKKTVAVTQNTRRSAVDEQTARSFEQTLACGKWDESRHWWSDSWPTRACHKRWEVSTGEVNDSADRRETVPHSRREQRGVRDEWAERMSSVFSVVACLLVVQYCIHAKPLAEEHFGRWSERIHVRTDDRLTQSVVQPSGNCPLGMSSIDGGRSWMCTGSE